MEFLVNKRKQLRSLRLLHQQSTMDNNEDVVPDGVVIFSSDDLLRTGLSLLGWTEGRIERQKENTNVDQYKGMYGLHLFAVAQLIEELQTTKTGSAKVEELDVEKLHWTLNFLYRYPRETEMESLWKKCAIDWNSSFKMAS